jgi:hypothetical protein
MKKKIFPILAGLTISCGVHSQCVTNSANIYSFDYNGDSYEVIKENLSWADAASCAVERGGILAEINSQEEQDSIFFHVNHASITGSSTIAPDGGGASYLWLGGNDLLTEGEWVWNGNNDTGYVQFWQGTSSGSAVNGLYSNWGNEPDDFGGQDALGLAFTNWPLGSAGQWNDVNDQNTLYYIIEYKTTPLSINEFDVNNDVKVYPNPSTGTATIEVLNYIKVSEGTQVQFFNVAGIFVRAINLTSNKVMVENLENGIYIIKLVQDNKDTVVAKLVVNN